ncbi:hypothetical protein SNE40_007377 [Patella caerulea]|uniref:NAD-dependent epimerase/dehydratase domain-containing protein n=1 Tax=Patella caerulea TaxID=87958 RepID=A0AAN8JWL2_PATCE
MAQDSKARVLVLGGTGFVGRNFVHYLLENDLVSKVRVVDKVPPQMAWLNQEHKESFTSSVLEFKHANLINPASTEEAFSDDGNSFDYVVNLAAETKYGQSDPVYKEGIVKLSQMCIQTAAKHKVKMYIEFSTGQMHSTDKKPVTEETKCEPWTHLAKHKLEVEKEFEKYPELNHIIIRPAIIYGIGDRQSLTPRLMIGAIYKYTKEKMKMLWTKDLKMNTVHVIDVCRAIWFLFTHGKSGEIYNLCDKGDTDQGKISELVSEIFSINFDFVGSIMSNMAKINMSGMVEDINDEHLAPWADACQRDDISNTPLNPCIDQELLYNKHLYLDGSKIENLGFTYQYPELKIEYLKEVLQDYLDLGLFPRSLMSGETFFLRPNNEEDES